MINLSRKDFVILLGNAIDHFDTALYIFLAPTFAQLFFPHSDPMIALIMTYTVLGTSVITSPVGSYIFGMIASVNGPERALSYSLIGVGLATFAIGLLPDYSSIGIFAPIFLILLRILREVFSSGEHAIAKLYILQNKPQSEAFKSSYLYETSTMFGMVLASIAATLVHYLENESAWRMCYIFGGVAVIIGFFIRKSDSSNFTKNPGGLLKIYTLGGINALWNHRSSLFRVALANSFSHLTYTIPFVTMNHIVPLVTSIEEKTMMAINSFMLVFDMIVIPVVGKMIFRFNPSHIMILASFVLAVTIIPLWYYVDGASIIYITFLRFWIVIWGIIFLCPLNLWCKNQVEGENQYIVVGMGDVLGTMTIGKFTPVICLALYYYTGSYMSISVYVALIFSAVFIMLAKSN